MNPLRVGQILYHLENGGPGRCVIYTRKSSEDGLEQEFSLAHFCGIS